MRKYITLFFSLLFLGACSNTPSGIINKDEMANLLTDVHIADGTLITKSQETDTLYKYGTDKYLEIFKKYNTDSATFKRSYKYYTNNPKEFVAIYDKVVKNLQAKTDSVTKLITKQVNANGRKPHIPAAAPGRLIPEGGAAVPNARGPQTPAPPNNAASARAIFEKQQAKRDSLLKKNHKNALPAK